jgi:hypothetical protein
MEDEVDGTQEPPAKTLVILYLNAQSVVGKINDLCVTAADVELDLI